jgi:hypothetical protein
MMSTPPASPTLPIGLLPVITATYIADGCDGAVPT